VVRARLLASTSGAGTDHDRVITSVAYLSSYLAAAFVLTPVQVHT